MLARHGSLLEYTPAGYFLHLIFIPGGGILPFMEPQGDARRKLKQRLNRIAGQVAGIQRMVDEDRYCVDILTQIAAVRSALDSVGVELLTEHVSSCVIGHGTESEHECAKPMTQEQLVEEVKTVLGRFLK